MPLIAAHSVITPICLYIAELFAIYIVLLYYFYIRNINVQRLKYLTFE